MKNTSTRTIRTNTGKVVECIEMQSGGNKYGTQLNSTENKTIIHTWHAQMSRERDITPMTTKRGIKMHVRQTIESMYKDYIQLDDMKVMGLLIPEITTKSQKGGHYGQ